MASTSSGAAAAASANPRKFKEKIAEHKRREEEETAAFQSIMDELNSVKGQQQRSAGPGPPMGMHSGPVGVPGMGLGHHPLGHAHLGGHTRGARLLTPHGASSLPAPRHGSLPNVNAAMAMQLNGLQVVQNPDDYPLILGASLAGGMNPFGPGGVGAGDSGGGASGGHILHQHVSVRDSFVGSAGPIRTKSRIDTSPYGADRYSQGGYHLSPPDPSWRRVHSDSSIHQSVGGNAAGGPGANHNGNLSPIHGNSPRLGRRVHERHQVQMSPTARGSPKDAQILDPLPSYLHLPNDPGSADRIKPGSLPDLTNFHVNPAAASQPMEGDDQGSPYSSSPVASSPWSPGCTGASPRGSPARSQTSPASSVASSVPISSQNSTGSNSEACAGHSHHHHHQIFFPTSAPSAMPLSEAALADAMLAQQYSHKQFPLDQLYGQQSLTQPSLPVQPWFAKRFGHLMQPATASSQQTALSSANAHPSAAMPTSVLAAMGVNGCTKRTLFSDNEISEILSIPMALVTEQAGADEDRRALMLSGDRDSGCDKSSTTVRNVLHVKEGLSSDQSGGSFSSYYQGHSMVSPKLDSQQSMSYRNPQPIPQSHSPIGNYQGSPIGRSGSPIDLAGSPLSPHPMASPLHSPDAYANAANAGHHSPGGIHNELSKDFQKFSVDESSPGSNAMFFQDAGRSYKTPQPMSDLVGFFGNSLNELKSNQYMAPQTPQTPTSIPDIILTEADDGGMSLSGGGGNGSPNGGASGGGGGGCNYDPSDPILQRAFNMSFDGLDGNAFSDCMLPSDMSANFSDLGKLDDSMLRLLTDGGGGMDLQIADPLVEEQFKSS